MNKCWNAGIEELTQRGERKQSADDTDCADNKDYLLKAAVYNTLGAIAMQGVMTSTSTSSRFVADRYGFEFCTGNEDDILGDDGINTVFIATRHDSHGYYVKKALEAGKHVFVEKPLCLTIQELEEIRAAYQPSATIGWL